MSSTALLRIAFCLLALLPGAASWAQGSAVMAVSVTVVNTCRFGQAPSCALAGTRLVAAPAGSVALASDAPAGTQRHIMHL